MDLIKQLGELAFGSRIKRISNMLMADGLKIYNAHQIDFEPKWFPAFFYLNQQYPNPVGVTEIAEATLVSHPLINRFVNDLIKKGLVLETGPKGDKRKRLVQLSEQGRQLVNELKPIWENFELSLRDIICDADPQLMQTLEKLENRIYEKGLLDTYSQRLKEQQLQAIRISEDTSSHFSHFKNINMEWLETHFDVEPHDVEILENPQQIIDEGGHLFFAEINQEILGTCAILNLGENAYELSKMGVYPKARGKQIGKKLMAAAIEKAKSIGAKVIYLETNNVLKTAIQLYLSFGFEHTPTSHTGDSLYQRANVFMKLEL